VADAMLFVFGVPAYFLLPLLLVFANLKQLSQSLPMLHQMQWQFQSVQLLGHRVF
jgi:hypothetical protein